MATYNNIKKLKIGNDVFNLYDSGNSGGTITSIKTTAGAHTTVDVTSGAVSFNVPTSTSHLTNDSDFITTSALSGYAKLSGAAFTGNISTTGTLTVGTTSATKTTTLHGKVVVDSVTGSIIQVNNDTADTDTFVRVDRTDTNVGAGVGVGTGGENHGLYSFGTNGLAGWICHSNGSSVYLNESKVTINSSGQLTVQSHSTPIGSTLSATASKSTPTANINTFVAGPSISLPAGTWIVIGKWHFASTGSSTARQCAARIYNVTSGSALITNYAAYGTGYAASVEVVWYVSSSSAVTVRLDGSNSQATSTASDHQLRAVRVA